MNRLNILMTLLFLGFSSTLLSQVRVDGIIHPYQTNNYIQPSATNDYIDWYQKYISQHKNSRCAMYPSCSNYGLMVFSDRPFWEAMILTADRLTRCSHDARFYESTYAYGYRSLVDYPYYKVLPRELMSQPPLSPHVSVFRAMDKRDSTFLFIHHLINRELYDLALLKIEELQFGRSCINDSLFCLKLICYRGLRKYEEGVFEYQTQFSDSLKENGRINLQAALLYKQLNNLEDADKLLQRNIRTSKDSSILYQSYNLQAIIQVYEDRLDAAEASFVQATRYNSKLYEQQTKSIELIKQIGTMKKKSPLWAGILSLIPGVGYFYTGHTGSALASLAINSLLAYSTYSCIKTKNYGLAGVCGFLSFSFYLGNINGASRSAHRYNQQKRMQYIKQLEEMNHIYIY